MSLRDSRPQRPIPANDARPTFEGLLAALSAVPRLDGAACKGHAPLFDNRRDDDSEPPAERAGRHKRALVICETCPALDPCRAWADTFTPSRLQGVIGGKVRTTSEIRTKADPHV